MDAQALFTLAWLDPFICLSCSGYKLETCFLWKNLFCSCRCGEVAAGTPCLASLFSQFSGNVGSAVGSPSCSCVLAGYARSNAWSVWEVVTILLPPSRSCGLPKRGPRAHPYGSHSDFPAGSSCKTSSDCGCEEGKGVDFHTDGRRQRKSVC